MTRPAIDGYENAGTGQMAAKEHYDTLVEALFQGDTTKIVFGFCISDCSFTGSNANPGQAAAVIRSIGEAVYCRKLSKQSSI